MKLPGENLKLWMMEISKLLEIGQEEFVKLKQLAIGEHRFI